MTQQIINVLGRTPDVAGSGGSKIIRTDFGKLSSGGTPTTLSSSLNVTRSNGDLTATHTTTTTGGARSVDYKGTGKFYFEVTIDASTGSHDVVGILAGAKNYDDMQGGYDFIKFIRLIGGYIFSNGGGAFALGTNSAGHVVCAAIDLDNRRGWFRNNGGNWNNNASHSPAANTGGIEIVGALTFAPAVSFGGTSSAVNDAYTANFGQVAYAYTPPVGFGNWNV